MDYKAFGGYIGNMKVFCYRLCDQRFVRGQYFFKSSDSNTDRQIKKTLFTSIEHRIISRWNTFVFGCYKRFPWFLKVASSAPRTLDYRWWAEDGASVLNVTLAPVLTIPLEKFLNDSRSCQSLVGPVVCTSKTGRWWAPYFHLFVIRHFPLELGL